jgi:hypothetical protein
VQKKKKMKESKSIISFFFFVNNMKREKKKRCRTNRKNLNYIFVRKLVFLMESFNKNHSKEKKHMSYWKKKFSFYFFPRKSFP